MDQEAETDKNHRTAVQTHSKQQLASIAGTSIDNDLVRFLSEQKDRSMRKVFECLPTVCSRKVENNEGFGKNVFDTFT